MKTKTYGTFAVASDGPLPGALPDADHILGLRVVFDSRNRAEAIEVQYRTAEEPHPIRQFRMDFPNALFLLSLLKSMQLDAGIPFPDDPRA